MADNNNVNLPPGKAMAEGKKWYYYSRRTQNRITTNGYWKSLGCDEQIISSSSSKRVGVKKYYVFHVGEAPDEGVKTNWIMQEFRLSDGSSSSSNSGRSKRKGHSKTKEFKNVVVGNHWNGLGFSWNWRRALRECIEDDQYHRICDIVEQLCKHLDCLSLPSHYLATRWNKIVPRKVNIHAWRLLKDCLPTRFNLWFRGIDIVSLICPMCSNGLESIYHRMSEYIIAIKV
ncbi:No apical meristem (NAM) protein [Artemisia annua]|uniref:No apical meristem (NAM) protein n=1 Tax=Artemisia annua TaxID=35608 RepID=A0A2U1L2E7_ARTAN|nr:No apical meristem (NAM) protein [Artemisia annua]